MFKSPAHIETHAHRQQNPLVSYSMPTRRQRFWRSSWQFTEIFHSAFLITLYSDIQLNKGNTDYIMQQHTFLSQTKHAGLAVCISAKHPLLLHWNLSEITVYRKNTVPQKFMPYKKLCYLNSSHSLPPWRKPWQASRACVSAWVTNPPSSPSHSAPVRVLPLCLLECLGWETPSQLGYQDKSEWGKGWPGAHGCASEGRRKAAHPIFQRSPPGTRVPAMLLARAVSVPLAPVSDCFSSQAAPGGSLAKQPLPS